MPKFHVYMDDKYKHGRNDVVSGYLVDTYDAGVYEASTVKDAIVLAKAATKRGGRKFRGTLKFVGHKVH